MKQRTTDKTGSHCRKLHFRFHPTWRSCGGAVERSCKVSIRCEVTASPWWTRKFSHASVTLYVAKTKPLSSRNFNRMYVSHSVTGTKVSSSREVFGKKKKWQRKPPSSHYGFCQAKRKYLSLCRLAWFSIQFNDVSKIMAHRLVPMGWASHANFAI